MKALESRYKGYLFRSRLEARWAIYLDTIGLEWEYESEGFDLDGVYYLPDFWLPQVNLWAEVKPFQFSKEEMKKAELLVRYTGKACLLLIGTPGWKPYDVLDGFLYSASDSGHSSDVWVYDREPVMISMYREFPTKNHTLYPADAIQDDLTPKDFSSNGIFADVDRAVCAARGARWGHVPANDGKPRIVKEGKKTFIRISMDIP